jgi:hypothetical protein
LSEPDWWTTAAGPDLEQGDVLFDLPVVRAHAVLDDDERPVVDADIERLDVIVTTQTCDLRYAKSAEVLVSRVMPWGDFAAAQLHAGNTAVKSSGYIDNLIRGNIPALALLYERTKRPALPWSVVDFRELYTVDRRHVDVQIERHGSRQRLRLRSPYKEHFAQAFARYFMRVGLPHDAAPFRRAGKQAVAGLTQAR